MTQAGITQGAVILLVLATVAIHVKRALVTLISAFSLLSTPWAISFSRRGYMRRGRGESAGTRSSAEFCRLIQP
jgi:hypothetical protein